jgi:IclR family pca regulon transcriptional regulator
MASSEERDPQTFIRSLARGLAAIEVMGAQARGMTLSELATRCGLDRATARRILLTLVELGYVRIEDNRFFLTTRVLALGYAYLSSFPFWEAARPLMSKLVDTVHESCSAATLEGPYVVYVARIRTTNRVVDVARNVGSRVPAYCTSLGRVLLAAQPLQEQKKWLSAIPLAANTEFTVTDPKRLLAILAEVKTQGWSLVDQELELGLRSLAVPIDDGRGQVIGALNVSVPAGRVAAGQLKADVLPALRATAAEVAQAYLTRGGR